MSLFSLVACPLFLAQATAVKLIINLPEAKWHSERSFLPSTEGQLTRQPKEDIGGWCKQDSTNRAIENAHKLKRWCQWSSDGRDRFAKAKLTAVDVEKYTWWSLLTTSWFSYLGHFSTEPTWHLFFLEHRRPARLAWFVEAFRILCLFNLESDLCGHGWLEL